MKRWKNEGLLSGVRSCYKCSTLLPFEVSRGWNEVFPDEQWNSYAPLIDLLNISSKLTKITVARSPFSLGRGEHMYMCTKTKANTSTYKERHTFNAG
jgi:hypothetical protein